MSKMPATIGGLPTVSVDVPALAIFMALYVTGAVCNMTIFQINRRRGIKFIPSVAIFGFCMSRIVTCSLRIAWATHPTNSSLAIASQIFVNAGILILYIINIVFAQRILRATKPKLGWNSVLRLSFKLLYLLILVALIMVITMTILTFETTNMNIKRIARDFQLAAITYLFVVTVVPMILLGLAVIPPKHQDAEHFGQGSMRSKILIVFISTCLCITISGFKVGTLWEAPRPVTNPAWYHSKAAFYVFNFSLEILLLLLLTPVRIDRRFHVPNGSNAPGDYSKPPVVTKGSEGKNFASSSDEASDAELGTVATEKGTAQLEQKPKSGFHSSDSE